MLFSRFFLIASVIGSALAQFNVSAQCQNTIIAVAANPQASCINPNGLIQIYLQGNKSIVAPTDAWLKGLCALGPCSNDALTSIVTNVTTGCAQDLQFGNTQPGSLAPLVQQVYPTFRKAVCLADTSNTNQLCVTQTLSNIETATGTLTIDKLSKISSAIASGNNSSLNGVNFCTPCDKQIYNVVKTDFPSIFGQGTVASDVQTTCGASFVDGASDPNIVQTAGNKTTGNTRTNTNSAAQTGQQALLSAFLLGLLALAV